MKRLLTLRLLLVITVLGVGAEGCKRKEGFVATTKKKAATLTSVDWPGTGDKIDSAVGQIKDLPLPN